MMKNYVLFIATMPR